MHIMNEQGVAKKVLQLKVNLLCFIVKISNKITSMSKCQFHNNK